MSISNEQWFANPGGAYEIDYSCRFNDDDSAYLSKTLGTPTDATNWTFSCWIKRCTLGTEQYFFNATTSAFYIRWGSDDKIRFRAYPTWDITTTAVFRDTAAWYHLVGKFANGAVTLYMNNTSVGSASVSDAAYKFFENEDHTISANVTPGEYCDHYMAEVVGIDGTAYNPSDFAETNDNGVWVPKDVSGLTFGDNGFWLDFADSSALGNDVSGNNNDWASSGLAANDQVTDTPTKNYCTLNFLDKEAGPVMSNGNLRWTQNTAEGDVARGTMLIQSGKWYWEATVLAVSSYPTLWKRFGIVDPAHVNLGGGSGFSKTTEGWSFISTGNKEHNDSSTSYGADDWGAVDDVVGIAFNFDTGTLWFSVNGTWQNSATKAEIEGGTTTNAAFTGISAPTSGTFVPAIVCDTHLTQTNTLEMNFGQHDFAGTPPDDFLALNTANLPAPAISDPSAHFQVIAYTGNATGSRAIITSGNSDLPVDLVIIKNRDQADEWKVVDSVRGATKEWNPDSNNVESTDSNGVTAFSGSDGFTLGTGAGGYNDNAEDFIAYAWEESVLAGFDMVLVTGTGSIRTVSHSLSAVPTVIWHKERTTGAAGAYVYHHKMASDPETDVILMHTANTIFDTAWMNDTAPTSSVYSLGTSVDVNETDDTYITYLWTEVVGFSKFGSWTGNGSSDGPMVHCGFKPAFILVRKPTGGANWEIVNNLSSTYNLVESHLRPDNTNVEDTTSDRCDFLANGFKIRTSYGNWNDSGDLYIFMAFAENPFGGSGVAPATAR